MAKAEDASIDSILKSIREAIIEKEQRELAMNDKTILVSIMAIMKKYQIYFAKRAVKTDVSNSNDNLDDRVCVKENSLAWTVYFPPEFFV